MAGEEKRAVLGGNPSGDTTTRARNRTVMMSSELTGQVRARLGGEFQPVSAERSGGFVTSGEQEDDGWSAPDADAKTPASPASEMLSEEEPMSGAQRALEDEDTIGWAEEHDDASLAPDSREDSPAANLSGGESSVPQFRESNENDYPSMATEEEEPQVSTHAVAPIRILKRATEEMVVESAVDSTKVFQEDEETVSLSKRDYLEPLGDEMSEFEGAEDMTGDLITWKSDTTLVGFLISYDNDKKGQYVELRTGRLMVTSEFESSGNCFVVRHPSVSPMHAIMRVGTSGSVQVLDQLSEHGTRIKHVGVEEEEFLSGEKGVVNHGDIVYFGDRAFYVCLITPPSE